MGGVSRWKHMTQAESAPPRRQNFIGGQWVDAADGRTYERRNPYDQSLVALYQDSGEADAAAAIDAARRAFDDGPWPRMNAVDRAAIVRKAAALLRERMEIFVDTMTREVGQPKVEMRKGVVGAADTLDYYAGLVVSWRDDAVYGQRQDALGIVAKEPIGVVGSLTAWNAPLSITHKACPGLAAGCTLVFKPAHQSSGAAILLAQVFADAGLPPGVFNVVTSARENGAIVGQAIAASDKVDMVTFTGSSATGKSVMRAAAGNLKRVKLELGGKSPNVVFADAPSLDAAAASAASGIVRLAGQSCEAGSRLLVQESVKEEFLDKLLARIAAARLGDPLLETTTVGPLVTQDQLQRVESYVGVGRDEGRLLAGGRRPQRDDLARGWFLEPAVFDGIAPEHRLAQEEVFGPVLAVLTFQDLDDAIRIANQSRFGLVAGCWSSDINKALKFARSVRAGGVWVNSYRDDAVLKHMPKGGFKQSGIGREVGPEGLDAFLETKSIMIKLA